MRKRPHRRHQHRPTGSSWRPCSEPRRRTGPGCRSSACCFQPEGAGAGLRQRKQACREQIDKLQDLILRLLQLPGDKRNPETPAEDQGAAHLLSWTRAGPLTNSLPRRSARCRR